MLRGGPKSNAIVIATFILATRPFHSTHAMRTFNSNALEGGRVANKTKGGRKITQKTRRNLAWILQRAHKENRADFSSPQAL